MQPVPLPDVKALVTWRVLSTPRITVRSAVLTHCRTWTRTRAWWIDCQTIPWQRNLTGLMPPSRKPQASKKSNVRRNTNIVLLPCRTHINLTLQLHDKRTAVVLNVEFNLVAQKMGRILFRSRPFQMLQKQRQLMQQPMMQPMNLVRHGKSQEHTVLQTSRATTVRHGKACGAK